MGIVGRMLCLRNLIKHAAGGLCQVEMLTQPRFKLKIGRSVRCGDHLVDMGLVELKEAALANELNPDGAKAR